MQSLIRRGGQLASRRASDFKRAATGVASVPDKPVVEKEFLVYRWNPDEGRSPEYQSYKVDLNS